MSQHRTLPGQPSPTRAAGTAPDADRGRGQGLIAYALLLSLVTLAVIVALICLGPQLRSLYS